MQLRGKPRGVAPCPHQRLCLWTPRRVFDPLDTHFAIELSALSGYARVLIRPLSRRSGQRGLAAIKVNKHGAHPKGSRGRSESPLVAPAGAKSPACGKEPLWSQDQLCGRAHLARQYAASWIEQLGGRSCGSAKLLAGTLRCLHLCWRLPWNWSPAQQLGRCPKPHKGRRPLTLQGTLSLDPFWLPGLGALPYFFFSGAFFAFSFAFFS